MLKLGPGSDVGRGDCDFESASLRKSSSTTTTPELTNYPDLRKLSRNTSITSFTLI